MTRLSARRRCDSTGLGCAARVPLITAETVGLACYCGPTGAGWGIRPAARFETNEAPPLGDVRRGPAKTPGVTSPPAGSVCPALLLPAAWTGCDTHNCRTGHSKAARQRKKPGSRGLASCPSRDGSPMNCEPSRCNSGRGALWPWSNRQGTGLWSRGCGFEFRRPPATERPGTPSEPAKAPAGRTLGAAGGIGPSPRAARIGGRGTTNTKGE